MTCNSLAYKKDLYIVFISFFDLTVYAVVVVVVIVVVVVLVEVVFVLLRDVKIFPQLN